MKKNGFGLIILLVSMAIGIFIFFGAYYGVSTGDSIIQNGSEGEKVEKKSVLKNQLNSVKKAEEAKRILEDRDRNMLDMENY